MAEEEKDLKKENDTPGEESTPENEPKGSEPLKTPEETSEEKAERLLKDGTAPNKEIKVSKKTYDDRNEKAKLYETHAALLDRVLKDPDLVEQLLDTKDKGNLDERLARIEEERKEEKRKEIRVAVTEALSQWPDFEKSWSEIQPIANSLYKTGISYKDAVRRSYFAINPEAATVEKERLAKEGLNYRGTFSNVSGYSPNPVSIKDKPNLNDNEKRIAKALGKSEGEYASLLEKHNDWLKTHGFQNPLE